MKNFSLKRSLSILIVAASMIAQTAAAWDIAVFGRQHAESIRGRIVAVLDGDTVTLLDASNLQHRIRLAEIDAPEIGHGAKRPGQPFGDNAKRNLSALCFQKQAEVSIIDTDRYGRKIGVVFCDGMNVNLQQVKDGMAWAYTQYSKDPMYQRAADEARRQRRGLWSDPQASEPWNWRHGDGWKQSDARRNAEPVLVLSFG